MLKNSRRSCVGRNPVTLKILGPLDASLRWHDEARISCNSRLHNPIH